MYTRSPRLAAWQAWLAGCCSLALNNCICEMPWGITEWWHMATTEGGLRANQNMSSTEWLSSRCCKSPGYKSKLANHTAHWASGGDGVGPMQSTRLSQHLSLPPLEVYGLRARPDHWPDGPSHSLAVGSGLHEGCSIQWMPLTE
jgi:hypothetical protein